MVLKGSQLEWMSSSQRRQWRWLRDGQKMRQECCLAPGEQYNVCPRRTRSCCHPSVRSSARQKSGSRKMLSTSTTGKVGSPPEPVQGLLRRCSGSASASWPAAAACPVSERFCNTTPPYLNAWAMVLNGARRVSSWHATDNVHMSHLEKALQAPPAARYRAR